MPIGSPEYPWSSKEGSDLLGRAASVLAREASRAAATLWGMPTTTTASPSAVPEAASRLAELAGRTCPVTGAATPAGATEGEGLRRQAHELLGTIFSLLRPATGEAVGLPDSGRTAGLGNLADLGGRSCPITGAAVPFGGFDADRLRRQAHELIETLLVTFNDATGEKGLPAEDQVPLIRSLAPVEAGGTARATLRVANEEATPSEVTLYCTNFVADCGYEIPSLRVSISPRRASIGPGAMAVFEIAIAIPQQTPKAIYSGLLQAMGSKYVKAVLCVEVL